MGEHIETVEALIAAWKRRDSEAVLALLTDDVVYHYHVGARPLIGKDLVPEHVRSSPSFHIPQVAVPPEGINLREVIAHFERRLIESTLESTGGVQKDAARLLGLKPTTLNEMIKRHSILLPRDRERRAAARDDGAAAKTTAP